jgi:hypothetical protein
MRAREGAARSVGAGATSTSIAGGFKPLPENWTPRAPNLALDIEDPFQRGLYAPPRDTLHLESRIIAVLLGRAVVTGQRELDPSPSNWIGKEGIFACSNLNP